jgi:sn-glycerol 3-phosphate transport system ATP-binding protein
MSAISLDHVSKHWGSMRAVDDVSLTAEEGALLVLWVRQVAASRQH